MKQVTNLQVASEPKARIDVVNWPAIAIEVLRRVFIECGQRCAVSGEGCPPDDAHIVPLDSTGECTEDNLICLCGECHRRVKSEKWPEGVLEGFKKKPWVVREFGATGVIPKHMPTVVLTVKAGIEIVHKEMQAWLRCAVAAFLQISPHHVRSTTIKAEDAPVTFLLVPATAARKLLAAFQGQDESLVKYISPFNIDDILRDEQWGSTQAAFQVLLAWLDDDLSLAWEKYGGIQQKLYKLFEWQRGSLPDTCTEATIEQIIKKIIKEDLKVETSYVDVNFPGIATNVLKEHKRRPDEQVVSIDDDKRNVVVTEDPNQRKKELSAKLKQERQLDCLDECIEKKLSEDERKFILEYYSGKGTERIKIRKQMAERLGITENALRLRARHIRAKLAPCVKACVKRRKKEAGLE